MLAITVRKMDILSTALELVDMGWHAVTVRYLIFICLLYLRVHVLHYLYSSCNLVRGCATADCFRRRWICSTEFTVFWFVMFSHGDITFMNH